MNLFEAIPGDLFSMLSSGNRTIYADALDVLYDAFRENLKIPKSVLFSMLRSRLEAQLIGSSFEEDGIELEEASDLSGRARFLIRKLRERGWIDLERGDNFEEYVILPSYSIQLIELFRQLTHTVSTSGFSYVYDTYSTLLTASQATAGGAYEKMMALYGAYDKTLALIKMLKTVYHNINRFFQQQLQMTDVNKVLEAHFDNFLQRVVEIHIRPLKIKDSVPKYRIPILQVLDSWLSEENTLLSMAGASYAEKRFETLEECRYDLSRKLQFIKSSYEELEMVYLGEIDLKVRRYTRTTTQKIESLTNSDRTIRGNLLYLLGRLAKSEETLEARLQSVVRLCQQDYLCEKSLYVRKQPQKRQRLEPIALREDEPDLRRQAALSFGSLINSPYSKKQVLAHIEAMMGDRDILYTNDFVTPDDSGYILSLLSVLVAGDRASGYRVELLDELVQVGCYTLPQVRYIRKKISKER